MNPRQVVPKLISLDLKDLTSLNNNAFVLLAAFRAQARKEGWTLAEINAVSDAAMRAGYDDLLDTIKAHCTSKEKK